MYVAQQIAKKVLTVFQTEPAKKMQVVREAANVVPMYEQRETITTVDEHTQFVKITDFETLEQLLAFFKNEEKCIKFFINLRWHGNVTCPYCGCNNQQHTTENVRTTERIKKYKNKFKWKCNDCETNFTYTVGSIFQNTKLTLKKWFMAIFLTNIDGYTTKQIQTTLGVTLATAHDMLQRLRAAKLNANERFIFDESAEIESDESGDKAANSNKAIHKKDVNCQGRSLQINTKIWFGLVDRKTGKIKLFHIPTTDENFILGLIKQHVAEGATIYTDKFNAYDTLDQLGYDHFIVDHSKKEWANGHITTNLMEGLWANVKRLIQDIYKGISYKYTQMYLNEFVYRYNTRLAGNYFQFIETVQETTNKYISIWAIKQGLAA